MLVQKNSKKENTAHQNIGEVHFSVSRETVTTYWDTEALRLVIGCTEEVRHTGLKLLCYSLCCNHTFFNKFEHPPS